MQEEKMKDRLIRDGLDDVLERAMQEQELVGEYLQKELEDVIAALHKQGYTNDEIIKALSGTE
jgi:hypothetical protein